MGHQHQIKEAWMDQEQLISKISMASRQDVQHLLNFLNFEIKYLLRPKSAPSLPGLIVLVPGVVYDAQAQAAMSPEVSVFYTEPLDEQHGGGGGGAEMAKSCENIRNIEVPDRHFSPRKSPSASTSPQRRRHRPSTAPNNNGGDNGPPQNGDRRFGARSSQRPRSPTHPNYKEEEYELSTVVLRYVGHPDHYARVESRARHRAHRKNRLLPPLPAHVDEVTIEQQPRGSYVLEVFHGYLCVGDEFRFTSRRVEGYPFSLTIYVNRQCHVRLSACCESKRSVGGRLGQGFFQLLHVQGSRPCIKCLLEKDPIAQRHVARIQKLRGTYDSMGNRVPPPPQILAEAKERSHKRGRKKASYGDDYCQGSQRLDVTKDRLAVPSISPDQETEAARSRRKKAPRPKSAPKRSSSSPMADYTSPEEEEVFSEEEIKLPLDEYEEEKAENEAANNDADGQFRIAESANDQVNDWQDQNC